ncbi:hypothetical protein SUGI_0012220 [Cryptomeria japonica]|nr:hypothetical protein SUGI_0012220 [Cryptomeria japonica]
MDKGKRIGEDKWSCRKCERARAAVSAESNSKAMGSQTGFQDIISELDSDPRVFDPSAAENFTGSEDSSSVYHSAPAPRIPSAQSLCMSESAYSQTGAWAVFAVSLMLRLKVHGSLDVLQRLTLDGTIHFDIFYISDMFAMVASLVIGMLFTVRPPMSPPITSLLNIILVAAAASFVIALMTFGHMEGISVNEWIVFGFLGAVIFLVLLTLLLYSAVFRPTTNASLRLAIEMSQQEEILNNV